MRVFGCHHCEPSSGKKGFNGSPGCFIASKSIPNFYYTQSSMYRFFFTDKNGNSNNDNKNNNK